MGGVFGHLRRGCQVVCWYVLHRQKNIAHWKGRGKLFRENELTAREGSRAALGPPNAVRSLNTSTGRRSATVP